MRDLEYIDLTLIRDQFNKWFNDFGFGFPEVAKPFGVVSNKSGFYIRYALEYDNENIPCVKLYKGFNQERWDYLCRKIVYDASRHKFMQNNDLLEQLLATDGYYLVEASPIKAQRNPINARFFCKRKQISLYL